MGHRNPAPKRRWAVKVAAVILWLFGIVAAYFWAHKPFDADTLMGLGRSLASVAAWCGLTWLGAGVGRWIGGRTLIDERPLARLALSAGVGLGLLSLLTLGLGLVGWLRPAVAWGVVLLLSVSLWRHLIAVLSDLRAIRLPRPVSGFQRWLAVYSGASLALTFMTALAPPTGWDTLVYHLTGPRLFVEAGRVLHSIDLPYLGFPQLGEMQFTLGLLLVGEGVAPLLHFGYGLLALTLTASLADRAFRVRAKHHGERPPDREALTRGRNPQREAELGDASPLLAVALLLSVPTLLSLMARAYVDATLLFYVTAACYSFFRWREARERGKAGGGRRWLLLMGLFCGFCGSVKYTAIAIPFALALSLAWASRRDGLRPLVGRLVLLALVTVVVVSPWLLENWLTTDNPVYPFLLDDGVYWDAWRGWWYDRPGTGLAATAPWRLLTAPLEATVLGTEGTPLYEATVGPLLLGSLGLLVAIWRRLGDEERAAARYMLFLIGVAYAVWLVGLARTALLLQTRLLLPVFGLVAILGGLALDGLPALRRPQLDVAWLARAVVSVTLALLLFSTLTRFLQIDPLPVALGLEAREDYLARRLGWYYVAIETINRELPPDAVVLFLWEPRSYHCQRVCWPDALLDRWLYTTYLYGHDADALARAWRAAGVTHVLLHRAGYQAVVEGGFDPITEADKETLAKLLSAEMVPAGDFGDAYELYAFPAGDRP